MQRLRVVVTAVCGILVMTKPAMSESWKSWQDKGEQFVAQSEMDEACNAFRHALIEALHSHVMVQDVLRIHTLLASAYTLDGQFAQAEIEFRRALELEKKVHGPLTLDYAIDLAGLELLPTYSGGRDEGIASLKAAIANSKADLSEILTAKDYLAKLFFADGRFGEAESILLEAEASCERGGDIPVWTKAELLNDLSVVQDREGRYGEAAALDEQTIELIEKQFGRESSGLVAPLNNEATMYARLGRNQEAEHVFARAADLCEKTIGVSHPMYGEVLRNQAVVLRRLGKRRRAGRCGRKRTRFWRNRTGGMGWARR